MKKELIAYKDPKSPVSEVFRTLRTNIQFMSSNKKLETLLITSTFPSEGKSWVTSNLAVTFAQTGKKVILVDADMRKGRQYTIFETSPRPGLSNYLSGVDANSNQTDKELDLAEHIQKTEIDNLYLMPAGNIPPNPSELLVSPQMVKLIENLKQICDIVIIDGTPCELVTDSIILSRIVDSTIIVTAHKETKKDNLGKIIKNIEHVGGKLAGVVVNKMPISGKKYEQSYYYGSTGMGVSKKKGFLKKNRDILVRRANETMNKQANTMPQRQNKASRNIDISEISKSIKSDLLEKAEEKIPIKKADVSIEKSEELQGFNNLKNVEIQTQGDISQDRTNDILKQINEYLNKEKNS